MTDIDRNEIAEEIGSGGEARIFNIDKKPGLVAKIYKDPSKVPVAKLKAMISQTNCLPEICQRQLAWPKGLVKSNGVTVGYYMNRIVYKSGLLNVYNAKYKKIFFPRFGEEEKRRVAVNLARLVAMVHNIGYVIGDLNESNVLVDEHCAVFIVDADSFQLEDMGRIFYCTVKKDEFLPVELQNANLHKVKRSSEHDCFSLAVIIFMLLLNGSHPFRGIGGASSIADRIREGLFPFGQHANGQPPPSIAFDMLPERIKSLFIKCFHQGHLAPARRPSAADWVEALELWNKVPYLRGNNKRHLMFGWLALLTILIMVVMINYPKSVQVQPVSHMPDLPKPASIKREIQINLKNPSSLLEPTETKYAMLRLALPPLAGTLRINDIVLEVDGKDTDSLEEKVMFGLNRIQFETSSVQFDQEFDVVDILNDVVVTPRIKARRLSDIWEYDVDDVVGALSLSENGYEFREGDKMLTSRAWTQVKRIHFNVKGHAWIDTKGTNNFTIDNVFDEGLIYRLKIKGIEFYTCKDEGCFRLGHANR